MAKRHFQIGKDKTRIVSAGGRTEAVLFHKELSGNAPVNITLPVVSDLSGLNFSTNDGEWTGTEPITYTYAWRVNLNDPIEGETGNTFDANPYIFPTPFTLYSIVTATNAFGFVTVESVGLVAGGLEMEQ